MAKKGICFHHLCRKRTKVYKCRYCGRYFCKFHLMAKPAGTPRFKTPSPYNKSNIENERFMEEWHKPGGHGCVPFYDVWIKNSEEETKKYLKVLDELKKIPNEPIRIHLPKPNVHEEPDETYEADEGSKPSPNSHDEIQEYIPKLKAFTLRKNFWIVTGILILLLILFLVYATISTTVEVDEKTITKTRIVSGESTPSYSKYLNDISSSDKKQVTLIGFIKRGIEGGGTSGKHVFFVVDDYNNEIMLIGYSTELKTILPDFGKTEQKFSVKGIFKKSYDGLELEVNALSIYEGESETYTELVSTNRTSPKYPIIRRLVYSLIQKEIFCEDGTKKDSCSEEKPFYCTLRGLKENPVKCGCPTGQRVYKEECILEIKCSDNTLDPECSTNKPKQCVDGKLVDNPELCGCPVDYKLRNKKCVYIKCSDGTVEPDCSPKLKMQCFEGEFVFNPSKCGCPEGYGQRGDTCIKKCSDGTLYGECSSQQPKFCQDGTLINKASECGCPIDYNYQGELCISKYQIGPKDIELKYVINGDEKYIRFVVYKGVNDYLAGLPRSITYTGSPPSDAAFIRKNIDNSLQKEFIIPLVDKIKSITTNRDKQAKIAISIIQQIPYDMEGFTSGDLTGRYAYEVLYDQKGVCGEKSELLTLILKELGFGVALFSYELESHQALGIKCPAEYDYLDSGYCFVETANPTIITDIPTTYVGVGELKSTPEIIVIKSEGYTLENVQEEYSNAKLFERISDMGPVLDIHDYNTWRDLVNKYGIEVDTL